jgi:hypothetical protein
MPFIVHAQTEAAARLFPSGFPSSRREYIQACVENLFHALTWGGYPDTMVEDLFGIKMGDEVGDIVFNAWITLFKLGVVTEDNVASALAADSLPQHFETLVRANDRSGYTHALVSRGLFGSIPWGEGAVLIGVRRS